MNYMDFKTVRVHFIEKHTESICYTTDLKFLENYKFVDLTGVNNVGVANNNIVYVGGYTSERGLFLDEYNGNQKLEKKKACDWNVIPLCERCSKHFATKTNPYRQAKYIDRRTIESN